MSKALKIGLTVVVLGLALTGLLRATLREGTEYYKEVSEVASNPEAWHSKRLQLHGYVVRDSILRKRDSLEYRFKVTQKVGESTHVVSAAYTGIVPDTFGDDAEVVLKGTLGPEGFKVSPNGVMAKCPSKYEAQKKAASPGV
jgi:cytochrome c-type biogenesis protein CcmE